MAEPFREESIPVLLLKTKSAPTDTYEELFLRLDHGRYSPIFVPVFEHRFKQDALDKVRGHITSQGFVPEIDHGTATYGAMIFTSQRAVEAFTQVIEELRSEGSHDIDSLLPETLPLYVVGPATARGLKALNLTCPIVGEETGNGEALAAFILEDYNQRCSGPSKPPILFLVGDKRRDIIPKTLQSRDLTPEKRSMVHELVIYETGELLSFKIDFKGLLRKSAAARVKRQWVVVFSPTGCQAMLESLKILDPTTGKAKSDTLQRDILIATIGPTTRDYLLKEFGFVPDVCAETPSPDGIAAGIRAFEEQKGKP